MAAHKRRLAAEINVVPYIDVMLVLLIIFMVTAPLMTQGIEVDLPEVSAQPIAGTDETVTLVVDARGRFLLGFGQDPGTPLADDEVVRRLRAVLKKNPEQMVLVRADRTVSYGRVGTGMGLLQEAGAKKIGFQTDPAPERASGSERRSR